MLRSLKARSKNQMPLKNNLSDQPFNVPLLICLVASVGEKIVQLSLFCNLIFILGFSVKIMYFITFHVYILSLVYIRKRTRPMYNIGFLSFSLPQSLCFYTTSLAFLLKSLTNLSSLTLKERKIMEAILARRALLFTMSMGWLASFFLIHVYGDHSSMGQIFDSSYLDQMRKMQAYRPSSIRHDSSFSLATSLSPSPSSTGQPPVRKLMFRFTSWKILFISSLLPIS